MVIYGYLWLFMVIYGYLWGCGSRLGMASRPLGFETPALTTTPPWQMLNAFSFFTSFNPLFSL